MNLITASRVAHHLNQLSWSEAISTLDDARRVLDNVSETVHASHGISITDASTTLEAYEMADYASRILQQLNLMLWLNPTMPLTHGSLTILEEFECNESP